MGSTIVTKVQEDSTPIVVLQQYEFGDSTGVLSVRIKNDKKGPQTGDVVLDLDDAVISLLNYDPAYEYKKDNVCIYNGMLFRANTVPTYGEFKVEEWDELDKVDILAEDYRPNFAYEKNQICIVNHMFYRAKRDFISPAIFDIAQWEEIGGATVDDYTLNTHINRNQPIIFNNALYRAKDDFTTSDAGNIIQGWNLDKDKFEEVRSGDSTYVTKIEELDYDNNTKTFSIKRTLYQLNSSKEKEIIDNIVHDETIEAIKTTTASGINVSIKVPIAKYDKLGLIKSAKIMNNPHYRGEAAAQGTMDSFTNLKYGDFCDRLDTNSEWFYDGHIWKNIFKPINTTKHEKILENYVQVDDEGFAYVSMSSDSLLRIANDNEAERRIDTNFAINPSQLALYGGNLRQVENFTSLPGIGQDYDLYWAVNERRFYIWSENTYKPIDVEVKDFIKNFNYPKNTLITLNGQLYKAKNDFTSTNAFNIVDWEKIGGGIESWKQNTSYSNNSFVYHDGAIYKAKEDIVGSTDFDNLKWEKLTQSSTDFITDNNIDFYVNQVDGEDLINNGKTSIKPYKTLAYAISQIKQKIQTRTLSATINLLSDITLDNTEITNISNIVIKSIDKKKIKGHLILKDSSNIEFYNVEFYNDNQNISTFNCKNIKLESCTFDKGNYTLNKAPILFSNSLIDISFCNFTNNSQGMNSTSNSKVSLLDIDVVNPNFRFENEDGIYIVPKKINNINTNTIFNKDNSIGCYNNEKIREFKSNTYYEKDDQIKYKNLHFAAKNKFKSAALFDINDWILIEPEVSGYTQGGFYPKGQLSLYGNSIFKANENILDAPANFDSTKWTKIADTTSIKDFQPFWNYKKGELIYHNDSLYVVKDDFVSGNIFDENNFDLISSTSSTGIKNFQPNVNYHKDATIYHQGKLYRAIQNFTSLNDFVLTDWEEISSSKAPKFIPNHLYCKDEIIEDSGNLYKAKETFTSNTLFDYNDWIKIGNSSITNFSNNTYYPQGSIIVKDNRVYYSKNNFTSGTAFNENDWSLIGPDFIEEFDSNKKYLIGQIITYKNRLYRSLVEVNPGNNFNGNNWQQIDEPSIKPFIANNYYPKDAVIIYNNNLYSAKIAGTKTSFNEADWNSLTNSNDRVVPLVLRDGDKLIPNGANLNTIDYLRVGVYYKDSTTEARTLINCPTDEAFTLRVYNVINKNYDRENTLTWVYRMREIINLSGDVWTQTIYSNGTAGNFTYRRWIKTLKDSDISLGNDTIYKITHQAYGTTPPPAQAGKTIICLFTE